LQLLGTSVLYKFATSAQRSSKHPSIPRQLGFLVLILKLPPEDSTF